MLADWNPEEQLGLFGAPPPPPRRRKADPRPRPRVARAPREPRRAAPSRRGGMRIHVDEYDGFFILCVLEGDRQIACLRLNVNSPAVYEGCLLATVRWIGVTPKRRGEGIATMLYERAARLAASCGRTLASDTVFLKAGRGFWQKQERLGRAKKHGKRWVLRCTPRTRLRNPGDEELRALERAAAEGDPRAAEQLQRERVRRGMVEPRRAYVTDLLEPLRDELPLREAQWQGGPRYKAYVTHQQIAAGIRAVLKAKGLLKHVTVTTPTHSMANTVDLRGPNALQKDWQGKMRRLPTDIDPDVSLEIIQTFGLLGSAVPGWRPGADPPRDFRLHVNNRDDRSTPHSDYFHPAGPMLSEDLWPVFLAGVRRGIGGKRQNPFG